MELTPEKIAGASFRKVRKGYDPKEVSGFLATAAKALEESQLQATEMEARAEAAATRLQEVSEAAEQAAAASAAAPAAAESEAISRALLLAQRTADATVVEATTLADRLRREAQVESDATIDSARQMSAKLLEDARAKARLDKEAERVRVANEVAALTARRDSLAGDVDQLEQFLSDERDRLRTTAREIEALCDRVPSGLGSVTAPELSAADQPPDRSPADAALADRSTTRSADDLTVAIDLSAYLTDDTALD